MLIFQTNLPLGLNSVALPIQRFLQRLETMLDETVVHGRRSFLVNPDAEPTIDRIFIIQFTIFTSLIT